MQGGPGAMEQGPSRHRGLIVAPGAFIQRTGGHGIIVVVITARTAEPLWPAQMKQMLLAGLLIREALLEFIQGQRLLLHRIPPNCLFLLWLFYETGRQMFGKTELS